MHAWINVHLHYVVSSLLRDGMTYDGTASVLFIEVMKKRASARSYGLYTDYVLTKVGIVPIVGSVLPMELRDEARTGERRGCSAID